MIIVMKLYCILYTIGFGK